jgi:drug/metabolite transporter (DMT)-like permease
MILILLTGSSGALLSSLIFMALESTTVTNAVLLARLGPLLYAVLALFALGQPIRGPEWAGFGVITVGVVVTVLTGSGFALSRGDWLILASCGVYAVTLYVSKKTLEEISLRAMVFSRNVVSAVVFFSFALYYFGPHHFADAFAGQLWVIMSIYALVVVVGSQVTWYESITRLTPVQVAKWTVLTPAFGVALAFLINGERPATTQLIALGLVTVGLVIANLGRSDKPRAPKNSTEAPESSLSAN